MSQWYPKICEYDRKGWHANPYIGKEFYGVWGDFNVSVTIDSAYVLGGTGKVTNAKEVKNNYGGYEGKPETEKVTWRFEAKNVHDFVWAADKDYLHDVVEVGDDLTVHYQRRGHGGLHGDRCDPLKHQCGLRFYPRARLV